MAGNREWAMGNGGADFAVSFAPRQVSPNH